MKFRFSTALFTTQKRIFKSTVGLTSCVNNNNSNNNESNLRRNAVRRYILYVCINNELQRIELSIILFFMSF